jgi:hypothetical protein
VHSSEGVAPHELDLLCRHAVDLVLPDQCVAPDERRWGDHPSPARAGRVVGIAPQRVVVSIGDRDVAKGVGVGAKVMGWVRVRLGNPNSGSQPGDSLVGDGSRFGHIAYYR